MPIHAKLIKRGAPHGDAAGLSGSTAKPSTRGHEAKERVDHTEGVVNALELLPAIPEEVCGLDVGTSAKPTNGHPYDAWAEWLRQHPSKRALPGTEAHLAVPAASQACGANSGRSSETLPRETPSTSTPVKSPATLVEDKGLHHPAGKAGFGAVLSKLCSKDNTTPADNIQFHKKPTVRFAAPAVVTSGNPGERLGETAAVGEVDTAQIGLRQLSIQDTIESPAGRRREVHPGREADRKRKMTMVLDSDAATGEAAAADEGLKDNTIPIDAGVESSDCRPRSKDRTRADARGGPRRKTHKSSCIGAEIVHKRKRKTCVRRVRQRRLCVSLARPARTR